MSITESTNTFLRFFTALFPPPKILERAIAAIDISDTSIKYMDITYEYAGCVPNSLKTVRIPEGVVVSGVVKKPDELTKYLRTLKNEVKTKYVLASLPEELGYLFEITIPKDGKKTNIKAAIEFALPDRVPVTLEEAIFDYDIVSENAHEFQVSVTVYQKTIVEGYRNALENAGFVVEALEMEAQSVARSVVKKGTEGISMVIDFGRTRTGITITNGQTPIFTTTVHVGGQAITKNIQDFYNITEEEANKLKREKGLSRCDESELHAQMMETIKELVKEIQRHHNFWSSRRNEYGEKINRVERVLLCGGAAGLRGLPEYISGVLRMPVYVVNIWQNLFSVDEYIPKVSRTLSWQQATVVGLILRNIR